MEASWLAAAAGGALIGVAATMVWMMFGKIAGIAGMCAGALKREPDRDFRLAFLAGLVLAPRLFATDPAVGASLSLTTLVIAGLLVGVGARIANGCTSGHGICGVARSSSRSWLATTVFVLVAALVRVIANRMGGAA